MSRFKDILIKEGKGVLSVLAFYGLIFLIEGIIFYLCFIFYIDSEKFAVTFLVTILLMFFIPVILIWLVESYCEYLELNAEESQ